MITLAEMERERMVASSRVKQAYKEIVGYPRLALCLGKCGLSDSAFVSLKQVLLLVAQVC